ncbi:MAG: hypothetical protein U1F34_05105 [Gammaproteobacteria bacterium]
MRPILPLLAFASLIGLISPAQAAVVAWDESVNGDLSGNHLSGTPISLTVGSNQILGTTGTVVTIVDNAPVFTVDRDYFTITIGKGQQLDGIKLFSLDRSKIGGNDSFLGLQDGDKITTTPEAPSASELLGYVLYAQPEFGMNLLNLMKNAPGAKGFSTPLGPGTYTFWTQDTSTGTVAYGFDFQVSGAAPVPVPAALWLLSSGFGLLGITHRRKVHC